jgi:hypothetical protein
VCVCVCVCGCGCGCVCGCGCGSIIVLALCKGACGRLKQHYDGLLLKAAAETVLRGRGCEMTFNTFVLERV